MTTAPIINGHTRLDAPISAAEIAAAAPYLTRARQALADGDAAAEQAELLYAATPGEAGAELRRALGAYQRAASLQRTTVQPGATMRPGAAEAVALDLEGHARALERAIEPARAAVEQGRAASAAHETRLRELAASVANTVDRALVEARDRTRAALVEAEQRLADARARLELAERTPPVLDVATWARDLAGLRAEAEGYAVLAQQARDAAQAAEGPYTEALGAAWAAREAEARAELQRTHEAGLRILAKAESVYQEGKRRVAARARDAQQVIADIDAARAL